MSKDKVMSGLHSAFEEVWYYNELETQSKVQIVAPCTPIPRSVTTI